jgi:hypothetical protein
MDIATFPLIWRWSQPSHAVLPADVLGSLRPLTAAQIEALRLFAVKRCGLRMIQHRAMGDVDETGRWLASLQLHGSRVTAVWNNDTALSLPWETFVKYWSDFCYPASDDVDFFVEGGLLVLRWRHDEIFEYDERC